MAEKITAALILVMCAGMLVRMALGPRLRDRLDASLKRMGLRLQRLWLRLCGGLRAAWRWPASRRQARSLAQDAIRRARGSPSVEREGNVLRPRSFDKPRKPH